MINLPGGEIMGDIMKEKLVYVIDDDDIYHFTIRRMIKILELPYEVKGFTDGEKALNYITERKSDLDSLPEVILLDINMPVKNGWQFLDEFKLIHKDLHKDITIFIVSSSANIKDEQRARDFLEVNGYVVKPFDFEQLKACLA